jgi:internalin A
MVHLALLTQLKRLDLSTGEVTEAGLSQLKGWSRLTRLSLSVMDLEDYRSLSQFPELTTLELDLRKVDQIYAGVAFMTEVKERGQLGLTSLGTLSKLRELTVTSSSYPQFLLANIGRIQGLEKLTLDLPRNVPAADFIQLSRLSSLQSLRIDNSTLDDSALAHLAGLKRLKNLSLAGNPITDVGLSHLAGLTELETLELDRTKITDAGLIHLIRLRKCKNLTVANTRVTPNGFSDLRAQQKAP